MKSLILIIALTALATFSSCSKHPCNCVGETLTLVDRTGLDGCGWVFQTANGEWLEPMNLGDFDIPLFTSNVYSVQYSERSDLGSICMVGPIIEIECIELLNQSERN